jgi:trigger factor
VKLQVERKPESLVVLDITADDEEFADAMSKAVRRVSRDIQIPGFRKGKAPRSMIERYYGRDMFLREAADEVMDSLYRQALEQESITPVGEPSVEINDLEPVSFVVTVPVFPAVDLKDYAGIRVDAVDAAVEEQEVDEILERLRKAQAEWVEVTEPRAPEEGDQVTVDYEVTLDGEPFQDPVTDAQFILGETNLLTQLREKLEQMQVGDTASFDLAFEEDDETADPSIRGKSLAYTVTLKAIRERNLPDLDDAFAQKVNETATIDELRQQIRDDVHMGKSTDGRTSVLNQIVDEMAAQAEIDPPAVMVEEEVEHQLSHLKEDLQRSNTPYEGYLRLQGKTEDDLKDELRPEAARRLRNSLFLQEVAKQEGIEITPEEVDAEINRLSGPVPAGDDVEGAVAQAERMAQFYQSDYFRQMLRNELHQRKLSDRLIEIATEGNGAVLNPWVAPEPTAEELEAVVIDDVTVEVDADGTVTVDETIEAVDAEGDTLVEEVVDTVDAEGNEAIISIVDETDADGVERAAATVDVLENVAGTPTTDGGGYANAIAGDGTPNAPEGYPIKGNAESMLYHVPGGNSYEQTVAEYHFATEEDAQASGFRAARR